MVRAGRCLIVLVAALLVLVVPASTRSAPLETFPTTCDADIDNPDVYSVVSGAFATTSSQYSCDWGVQPPYDGPTYEDEQAAAAADPPPPAPVPVSLPTWRNLYDWPNGHGYAGWHSTTSRAGAYGIAQNLGGNTGLWLWPAGEQEYTGSDFAEWTYTAPGTTRIARVNLSFAYRNKLLAHHCLVVGLRTQAAVVAQHEWCRPANPPDSQRDVPVTLVDPSSNPTATTLFFRTRVDCKGASSCTKHIPALDPLQTAGTARLKLVDMTLVDDDRPVVHATGPLWELGYDHTRGGAYAVTVTATDAGSGVKRIWLEQEGGGELASRAVSCDPSHNTPALEARICPASDTLTASVETTVLPEGTTWFAAKAVDVAGNVSVAERWPVYVDRTAPAPASAATELFYDTGAAVILWTQGADPDLPDGVPGSGNDADAYRYRHPDGAWSEWADAEDGSVAVPAQPGDTLSLEVRSTDVVGNVGAATALDVAIVGRPKPPDEEILYPSDENPPVPGIPQEPPSDVTFSDGLALRLLETRSFDRAAAARYAFRYVGSERQCPRLPHGGEDTDPPDGTYCQWGNGGYNRTYRFYRFTDVGGGDCTNFSSQILKAGGWTDTGGPNWRNPSNWWYDEDNVVGADATWSWVGAPNFNTFVRRSDRAHIAYNGRNPYVDGLTALGQVRRGDVVQLDLYRDGKREPSHTLTVTALNPIRLTYHSRNRKNVRLSGVIHGEYTVNWVWLIKVSDTF